MRDGSGTGGRHVRLVEAHGTDQSSPGFFTSNMSHYHHVRLQSFLSDVMDDRVEMLIFPSCMLSRGLACLRKHLYSRTCSGVNLGQHKTQARGSDVLPQLKTNNHLEVAGDKEVMT